jgi:hypothetical protein
MLLQPALQEKRTHGGIFETCLFRPYRPEDFVRRMIGMQYWRTAPTSPAADIPPGIEVGVGRWRQGHEAEEVGKCLLKFSNKGLHASSGDSPHFFYTVQGKHQGARQRGREVLTCF